MGLIRPATPGFLVTLVATGLLAIVVFSVPYIKSVYFLKAQVNIENIQGSVTFGTLGYCMQLPNGTTCSKASVGYELPDVNEILGNNSSVQIPTVLVKWITYALVLHIVAVILSAISTFFGLLAHVREMSMAYCSSFISGFAASVALTAFVFDLVLFFVTKSRIKSVQGASVAFGTAVWLTLAAWILLFFAGCFYGIGRCCIRRRPDWQRRQPSGPNNGYEEQLRLDAVKAEADRKARQKQGEGGLPVFQELEQMQPLTAKDEEYVEEGDQVVPLSQAGVGTYRRQKNQSQNGQFPGGYDQAAPGTRAVDAYYGASPATPNVYPPRSPPQQPRRQESAHTVAPSTYAPSTYSRGGQAAGAGGYSTGQYGHAQEPTTATQNYGHTAGGTSYHNQGAHQQYPTNYSAPLTDPYSNQDHGGQTFDADAYNSTGHLHVAGPSSSAAAAAAVAGPSAVTNPYYAHTLAQPERSYTLGGGGYGANTVPNFNDSAAYYDPYAATSTTHHATPSPAPINTHVQAPMPSQSSISPRGPRPPSQVVQSPLEDILESEHPLYTDSPPMYDAVTAQPPGEWSSKH